MCHVNKSWLSHVTMPVVNNCALMCHVNKSWLQQRTADKLHTLHVAFTDVKLVDQTVDYRRICARHALPAHVRYFTVR